jgi:hypothetical protein
MMLAPWNIYCEGENLRGVLKHAWLENDVEKISSERAVERCRRNSGWRMLDVDFPVRLEQAHQLADNLEELFSPAQLVDKCSAYTALQDSLREQLKRAVHDAYLESSEIAEMKAPLQKAIAEFENAVAEFRPAAIKCADSDLSVGRQAWERVLTQAGSLKTILTALPHGIVFP